MIRFLYPLVLFCAITINGYTDPAPLPIEKIDPDMAVIEPDKNVHWFNALDIGLEGQAWQNLAHPYDRMPIEAEEIVRPAVWSLSRNSAGLFLRFLSDSRRVSARWSLRKESLAMDHMPATGVSGLDLYVRDGNTWRWVATGRPKKQIDNETLLISQSPDGMHEYMLYLPLYNGTQRLEIGLDPESTLAHAPDYAPDHAKPILFWGSSILQGGCASRTGMAYPSIIGRNLHRPTINLGFSGNGKMDPEIVQLIAKLDPAMYVIDCVPNMNSEMVAQRTGPLVRMLHASHPNTPIVLIENIVYQNGWFIDSSKRRYQDKNLELRKAYDRLITQGITNLHYIKGDNLLGDDELGTVDGVHPTDLGFLRMAQAIGPILDSILLGK
ncbi:MAG: SGNH/GDSL hydrolase family protein [Candidatus Hydrogenedentota bacterium]